MFESSLSVYVTFADSLKFNKLSMFLLCPNKKNGQKSQHQRKQEKWKHCKENALQQMLQLTSEKCCSPGGHIEKGKSLSLP